MNLTSFATESLKVMSTEYHIESTGRIGEEPIVTLHCRRSDGTQRSVEVEGFHAYFYTTIDAYEALEEELLNASGVRHIALPTELLTKRRKLNATVEELDEDVQTLKQRDVVRISTNLPNDVPTIRDWLHDEGYETFEADVFFTNRFLISNDIYMGIEVPMGDDRVHVDDVSPTDAPNVLPKIGIVDIEVLEDGSFPEPMHVPNPVTAITAMDTYGESYKTWVLHSDEWTGTPCVWEHPTVGMDIDIEVVEDEGTLLDRFWQWVVDEDVDMLSGWNSSSNDKGSGFDYPYLINRSFDQNVWSVEEAARDSSTAFVTDSGSAVLNGRTLLDMMQSYMKTQIHEKRSYALDYIASEELGYGKEDIGDLDNAYYGDPQAFVKYNIRDVEAVAEIEREKNVLEIYDHIRSLTGSSYNDIADSNIGIIDDLVLREARKRNLVLPTSTEPDVKYYKGAWVADPVAGLHENVVYPDLSSLYPNLFKDMNLSQETLIGDEDALRDSPYTKDDCHEVFIDPRDEDVKRETDDVQRQAIYALKPSVQESFVREVVDDLIELKYEYKSDDYADEAYAAIKRITNSVYGCWGDSNSYGVGFRLYDWRIAEAITLAGRDVIQHTADTFQNYVEDIGYDEAEIIGGDSVPADEPIIVKRDGDVEILPISEACVGDEVWSDTGFTEIKDVIKKPNRKQCYTVRSQTGLVHTTEDHALLRESGEEVTPEEVVVGDSLLHADISNIEQDGTRSISEDEAWLLGVFCAEGSAGFYETGTSYNDSKIQVKVSNQDTELLEQAQRIFAEVYNFETKIYDDTKSSNVHNIKPFGNGSGDICEMAAWLRKRCYTQYGEKKVPKSIINATPSIQKRFLDGFHDGDGHIARDYDTERRYDELWSKSKVLMQGLVYLLRQNDILTSLSYRRNHDSEYLRTRCPSFRRVDETECREIEEYEYDGKYVYDLETENHHFASGVGSMVVHNTDSCVCTLPQADGSYEHVDYDEEEVQELCNEANLEAHDTPMAETLVTAMKAAEHTDNSYEQFMYDRFNITDGNMAVEIESYASKAFFYPKKKRYAQHIRWDEGDLVDEMEVKGFELVRSDSAELTATAQKRVLELLLKSDTPKTDVSEYLQDVCNKFNNGEYELEEVGKPKAINKDPTEYGTSNRRPQPHIRGAKYASAYIDGEDITSGDKPLMFYVNNVHSSELPEVYEADTAEDGDTVDALALTDPSNMPMAATLDREKMLTKVVRDPIEPIIEVMGWGWADITSSGDQSALSAYM